MATDRFNLLTGRSGPAPVRATPGDPFQALLAQLRDLVQGITETQAQIQGQLQAIGTAEAERSRQEVKGMLTELLDAERAARTRLEADLAAARAALDQANSAHAAELQRLREALAAADTQAGELRADLERRVAELGDASRGLDEARQAAAAAEAARARVLAVPQIITQPPVKPDKVDLEMRMRPDGLLSGIVLKASGYADVFVEVSRGADNRIRNAKVRMP